MPVNNLPNNLPSIERLLLRIRSAEKSQQKEIRLTIQEANELSDELAVLTVKLSKIINEIHGSLAEIKSNNSGESSKSFDGGGF
jgi:hypothetical protein